MSPLPDSRPDVETVRITLVGSDRAGEDGTGAAPATVAVLGSCATRDNFNSRYNPGYRQFYECRLHQNQTSLIALMSPPMQVEWAPTGIMTDYDRWNIETEFDRSFLADVVELQPTYLILDFFADVHFGVLRLRDGNYVTNNRWKIRKTDWFENVRAERAFDRLSIFLDPAGYQEVWQEHYRRFDAFVREKLPDTTVVVHRRVNVELIRLRDRPRPVRLQRHAQIKRVDVAQANRLGRELDDFAIATSGAEQIDLTQVPWMTYEDHPLRPYYGHYEMPYYHRFLAELHQIHLRRTLGAEIGLMVRQVDRARAEEAALLTGDLEQQIARLRSRLERQAQRIAQLESRPTWRPRRFWRDWAAFTAHPISHPPAQ